MPYDPNSLPVDLAIRLSLDSVSYSNALPPWGESVTLNYAQKSAAIQQTIRNYLNGARPLPSTPILVPNRKGTKKRWLIPSVNDQVILQACVSALAWRADALLDTDRVFSYRYNSNPNQLRFTNSQIESWSAFKEETRRRLNVKSHMLQLDLQNAFQAINRGKFLSFIEEIAPKAVAPSLLAVMIESFAGSNTTGVPLINDSLFFLGNAFLRIVDLAVARHSQDYIRFVDDYRVFGESEDALEAIMARSSRELEQIGFQFNMEKVKLGTGEEFLDLVAKPDLASTEASGDYLSAAVLTDVIEPKVLVEFVAKVVREPNRFLNEGFGRLVLGSVRRMRVDQEVGLAKGYSGGPRTQFSGLLTANDALVTSMLELLASYLSAKDEEWRAIWLLYIMDDINAHSLSSVQLRQKFAESITAYKTRGPDMPLAALWAKVLWPENGQHATAATEQLHGLGYLEEGQRRAS